MFGIPLFPARASTIANEVDALYFFLVGLSVVMSVLIATLVVSFAIRFRRRHPDDVGAQVHGGLMLELAWTVVPFVVAMIIFFWGAKVYFVMASPRRFRGSCSIDRFSGDHHNPSVEGFESAPVPSSCSRMTRRQTRDRRR